MAQSQQTSGGKGGTTGSFDPLGLFRSALDDLFSTFGAETSDADRGDATETDGVETDDQPMTTVDFAEMEPEEALYALLCREDGKMKQSAMVTETGWSKSKVSRRLSNLEEAERIGRVRQGREKVVFVKPGARRAETEVEAAA